MDAWKCVRCGAGLAGATKYCNSCATQVQTEELKELSQRNLYSGPPAGYSWNKNTYALWALFFSVLAVAMQSAPFPWIVVLFMPSVIVGILAVYMLVRYFMAD